MESYVLLLFLLLGVFMAMQLMSIALNLKAIASLMGRYLSHHGIEWGLNVEPSARVKELALNPNTRVFAIKAYMEQTGLDFQNARL